MQLVDSKLYIANLGTLPVARKRATAQRTADFFPRLKSFTASERLLALLLSAILLTTSPALLSTIRSAVSLGLQILLEAGHFGLIAFQIFGR